MAVEKLRPRFPKKSREHKDRNEGEEVHELYAAYQHDSQVACRKKKQTDFLTRLPDMVVLIPTRLIFALSNTLVFIAFARKGRGMVFKKY